MRNLAIILALALGCGNGGGGGVSVGSYDQACDQTVSAMKELGDLLDKVTDKASAESAKPKLEALAQRLAGIAEGVEKLGPPKGGAVRGLDEKMRAALEPLSKKTEAYVMRVIDTPGLGPVLEKPFAAAQQSIMQLRGILGD